MARGDKGAKTKVSSGCKPKTGEKTPVANVNKNIVTVERNLRSKNSEGSSDANPLKGKKRNSVGIVAFDEISQDTSKAKRKRNVEEKGQHGTAITKQPSTLRCDATNNTPVMDRPVKEKTKATGKPCKMVAKFMEGNQVMKMAVDAQEEELYQTESSEDEGEDEDPNPNSQSRSSGSETEQEEGQLNDIEKLPLDMEQFGSSDEDISYEL